MVNGFPSGSKRYPGKEKRPVYERREIRLTLNSVSFSSDLFAKLLDFNAALKIVSD
jgi:hypothetical protein